MRRSRGKPKPRRQEGRASEHGRRKPTKAELRDLVEQATMDCYNESEEVTGLYTMIEEYLAVPFQTSVLGMDVTVGTVDLTDAEEVVVVCRRRVEQRLLAAGGLEVRPGEPGDLVVSIKGTETILSLEVKHRLTDEVLDRIERWPAEQRRRTVLVVPALSLKRRHEFRFRDVSWIEYQIGLVHIRRTLGGSSPLRGYGLPRRSAAFRA
jgi:hypothetical protein